MSETNGGRQRREYLVLRFDQDDAWRTTARVSAFTPDDAVREVSRSLVESGVNPEEITLVAVSARKWKPRSPEVTVTTTVALK